MVDTVIWTKEELDAALSGDSAFNLLPPDSPVTWGSVPGLWSIYPSPWSTPTTFMCENQNCGLIGCLGVV